MDPKSHEIVEKYQDVLKKNLEKAENGEEINVAALHALNDGIRILHHIHQMKRTGDI